MITIPIAKLDDVSGGKANDKALRLAELLAKYPEPWVIEKEPHSYNDGTKEFTHVIYRHKSSWSKGEEICVEIGSHVSLDLAELLILLRESAIETVSAHTASSERIRVLEEAARIAEPVIEEERRVILRSHVILYEKDPNVGKLDEEGQRLIAPLDNALTRLRAALHRED